MSLIAEAQPLPDHAAVQISRAWCAYKCGHITEIDLILLWLEAAAQAEGTQLHPGWKISPGELFTDVHAGVGPSADEQELERRGLGWLSGALEGPRRLNLIDECEEEITALGGVDDALRCAKARIEPSRMKRRMRPVA